MSRHLLVTNDFPPKVGGIQSYLWELWRRLDPGSFVVLTASSHPDAAAFDAEQARAGVRIERVPGRLLYFPSPATLRRIRALALEVGAGLVLLDPALPLGLLGPRLGRPYGVVLHGAEVTVPSRLPVARQTLGRVLAGASVVVSAGRYPAAEARRALGARPVVPGQRHVQVPPGVDAAAIVPFDQAQRGAARRRLGLSGPGPLVASVSRLVPRKGMDVLVEATARLVPRFPGLEVAIAGDGRDRRRLASLVQRSGAPVRLLGAVSEEAKAALLGGCDIFAMACRRRWGGLEQEGFGIVFLEAAAAGVPQVAGDSGGAAEAVVDGETGLVVRRPRSAAQVADALGRLLSDAELRRRMGARARRRAETEFDYGRLAATLAGALDEVQGWR